jgi:hypothetical protein
VAKVPAKVTREGQVRPGACQRSPWSTLTAQGSDLPGRAQQFVSNAAVGTRGKRVEFVIDFLNHQIATKRYEALVALKLKFAAGVRVRFRHETTLIADGTKASFRGIAKQLAPGGGASQPAPGTGSNNGEAKFCKTHPHAAYCKG